MRTILTIGIAVALLTGCRTSTRLPRTIRVDGMPYPFISTSHAGDPDTGYMVLRFKPSDAAFSVDVWNAQWGVEAGYIAPGRTSVVDYTLTLLATPRGEPLAIECRTPLEDKGSTGSLLVISPDYLGETNIVTTPSIRIDGKKTDNFFRDWARWMESNPQLEVQVLESWQRRGR